MPDNVLDIGSFKPSVPTMRNPAVESGIAAAPPPWAKFRLKMADGSMSYSADGRNWRTPDGKPIPGSGGGTEAEARAYAAMGEKGITDPAERKRIHDAMFPNAGPTGLPPGISLNIKGIKITNPDQPTTAEKTRTQKLSGEAENILKLTQDMKDLYQMRIAPKLKAGKIGSTSQGLGYLYSSRLPGTSVDPDVAQFITKSGALATAVNAYYAGQSGGRGGVGSYQEITTPHIPHPPGGFAEVAKGTWSLEKQADQLSTIQNTVRMMEGGSAGSYGKSLGKTAKPNGIYNLKGRQIVVTGGVAYDVGVAGQ